MGIFNWRLVTLNLKITLTLFTFYQNIPTLPLEYSMDISVKYYYKEDFLMSLE